MRTVLYSHEHWSGKGGLGLVSGAGIPLESRVLAVARVWATLTAQGGAGLRPDEALINLRSRAGQDLDPMIVAAAVKAVQDEIIELGPSNERPVSTAVSESRTLLGRLSSGWLARS
jgi:HD-GYP domain-containing protein (c-di-GMP phosphodiesterase class II)